MVLLALPLLAIIYYIGNTLEPRCSSCRTRVRKPLNSPPRDLEAQLAERKIRRSVRLKRGLIAFGGAAAVLLLGIALQAALVIFVAIVVLAFALAYTFAKSKPLVA
ncbi:MAG: hypothetical protein JJE46_15970 [Acidimicrobiia bacterium]|nr:hypothetical protein [Acidimicrobiia bacterium]